MENKEKNQIKHGNNIKGYFCLLILNLVQKNNPGSRKAAYM